MTVRLLEVVVWLGALVPLALAWSTLLGLGLLRHADPLALVVSTTVLCLVPGVLGALLGPGETAARRAGGLTLVWCAAVLLALPTWFPGEREDGLSTGLAALGIGESGRRLADNLSAPIPEVEGRPAAPAAEALTAWMPPPVDRAALEGNQIALPYEGEGRRLSVPVMLEHGDRVLEDVQMMLDTGATYTTLPERVLDALGIRITKDAPSIQLQTAGGERTARLVLLERLWLGDLEIEHVTIAVCEACASKHAAGLLGLNVTGGFNTTIDADYREVVLSRRVEHDRKLDITPFVDVGAALTRFAGERVEVEVEVEDRSGVGLAEVVAGIGCEDAQFAVPVLDVPAGGLATEVRRLPEHTPCPEYRVTVESAQWATDD